MNKSIWLVSCITLLPFTAQAQERAWMSNGDKIITDRPDVAESPRTVGTGRVQVEMGVDASDVSDSPVLGVPTKLRFGLNSWTELHLESDLLSWGSESNLKRSDLDVGTKIQLPTLPHDMVLGVLVAFTLPIGSQQTSGDVWSMSPTLALDIPLPAELGLGINVGIASPLTQRDVQHDVLRWAAAVGWGAHPLHENLGLYIELFGERAFSEGAAVSLSADGGFAFALTPSVQLDTYLRVGVLNAEETIGVGGGISFKL